MKEYEKIQTIFQRDMGAKSRLLIEGAWSHPAFEYLKNNQWVFTEKIDGTNIRVIYTGSDVIYKGKTEEAQIPATLVKRLMDILPASRFGDLPPLTLYSEGYGKNIQTGGNYIRDGVNLILFDVWIDGWWLERENIEDVASKLELSVVPIIGTGTLMEGYEITRAGFPSGIADCQAEGLVMRPCVTLHDRKGERIIAKIKHKDFKNIR